MQEYLLAGALDMGHARALLALPRRAAGGGRGARRRAGTVGARDRAPRARARESGAGATAQARARAPPTPISRGSQNELAEALGATVAIEPRKGGAGRVVIRYSSLEQLDGIIAKLR